MNAVAPGEGNANILIDGERHFPKGYKLGQRTGGFGLKAGPHTISIKKTGVETGTTKITLNKGETLSLIGFAEKVPPIKEGDPVKWKTKILRLKQSDPESGFRLALVPLCDRMNSRSKSRCKANTSPKSPLRNASSSPAWISENRSRKWTSEWPVSPCTQGCTRRSW